MDPLPLFLSSNPGTIDVLRSSSSDIIFNLATEKYLFEHCPLINPTLFMWRNTPSIIIGKHQNPWKECRVQLLEENGVTLARRNSGGGCVYQDLGNSVFSFINPIAKNSKVDFKTMNIEVLLRALKQFGIDAEASGRNDLVVENQGLKKKISGSAYQLKLGNPKTGEGKRSLHHGTMLLDVDLGALGNYLNPSKAKLESKGVQSVISRVMNLSEVNPSLDHDAFCDAVEDHFFIKYNQDEGLNMRTLDVEAL